MTIEDLVRRLMFGTGKHRIDADGLAKLGFAYRKNKTPDDFRAAWTRGLKAGHGKVEREESEIAIRLERVLLPCESK